MFLLLLFTKTGNSLILYSTYIEPSHGLEKYRTRLSPRSVSWTLFAVISLAKEVGQRL